MENKVEEKNLNFIQTIKIVNKTYKMILITLIIVGLVLFFSGWQTIGFIITLLPAVDFARRYGFDKGYFRGYEDGRAKGRLQPFAKEELDKTKNSKLLKL
jgi:hypothetical protein